MGSLTRQAAALFPQHTCYGLPYTALQAACGGQLGRTLSLRSLKKLLRNHDNALLQASHRCFARPSRGQADQAHTAFSARPTCCGPPSPLAKMALSSRQAASPAVAQKKTSEAVPTMGRALGGVSMRGGRVQAGRSIPAVGSSRCVGVPCALSPPSPPAKDKGRPG